jgi:cofilin
VTKRRALCPQASGVTVSDVCKTTYEEIKKDKKHRYVVFFIRDEKQIDVEVIGESTSKLFYCLCRRVIHDSSKKSTGWRHRSKVLSGGVICFAGDRNAIYDSFLEDLQKGGTGECRYGLFDFEYTHQCQGTSEVNYSQQGVKNELFLLVRL